MTDPELLQPAVTNPGGRTIFFPQPGDPELPWEGEWKDYEEIPPSRPSAQGELFEWKKKGGPKPPE